MDSINPRCFPSIPDFRGPCWKQFKKIQIQSPILCPSIPTFSGDLPAVLSGKIYYSGIEVSLYCCISDCVFEAYPIIFESCISDCVIEVYLIVLLRYIWLCYWGISDCAIEVYPILLLRYIRLYPIVLLRHIRLLLLHIWLCYWGISDCCISKGVIEVYPIAHST